MSTSSTSLPIFSDLSGGTSREFDLLRAAARVQPSPEHIDHLANCAESGIDWVEAIRLAENHGVLPLLARNLLTHRRNLAPEIEQSLRISFETNIRRNLWFASELIRIMHDLDARNIRALPYKGPLLAESVYGDLALRSFGDLDLLIRPMDFQRAKQALVKLGYEPSSKLTPSAEQMWLRTGYELSFNSAAGKYLVELQWGLLPHFYAVDLQAEDLLRRSRKTVLGEREVPALSPEDLLIVLCLHSAKHLWMRLIWICDIAETIRAVAVDYDTLISRARELGIVRIIGVSFWLVKEVLGSQIPEPAQAVVDRDPESAVQGRRFASRLGRCASYDFESTEYFRLMLRLRERRGDQLRYLWRLLWTPGAGDIAAVNLPETLSPLYRVVRVLRLMRKLG